ncbi:proton-conducting transporter membrane subunit [Acidocella sp.]|uniref:proton-conducting transporter transmembrane domain-containing protein n=1 Tax=Acidocella sp. TaxID=50710 RepID=UPI0026313E24|nr:proton-conducting transporter membrane subunit [Acidocella sp.]
MDHVLTIMFGLPGAGMQVRLDPLSVLFLVLLAPQMVAGALAGEARSPTYWLFALGMVLAVVAASAFTLIFGFELMSAASWLLVLKGDQKPATLYVGIAIFSAACLVPALFLPASSLAFVLIVLGAGAKAGLAPLHSWLPKAHPAPPAGVSALMSGGMIKVALSVIIREGFMTLSAAQQPWWGGVLIAAGVASVFIGALRAMLETEMKVLLACSTVEHAGLIAVGLGLALRAKAMGDANLTALGLEGALLCALAHALYKPLLFIGAGEVKHATGTASLDWLGGLMRSMPRLSGLMLLAASGMAALPLGPGFAPEFLILHAALAAAGTGGIVARIGFSALLAVLGLSAALALGAAVKLMGVGFLGRPRSLQAAAAEEPRGLALAGMALLGGLMVPLALVPAEILRLMAPVVRELAPNAGYAPLGYAPLPLLGLGLVVAVAAGFVLHRFGVRGTRAAPGWMCGFGQPPVWLPFGDPATQPTATGLAEPVARAIGRGVLPGGADPAELFVLAPLYRVHLKGVRLAEKLRRATIRERLAFIFSALVLFLLTLGLLGGG